MKLALLVYLCILWRYTASEKWNYQDQKDWNNLVNSKCGGQKQSPIDIITRVVEINGQLNLNFFSYKNVAKGDYQIKNNGHTVSVILTNGKSKPSITGFVNGNVKYTLKQFHLHWGRFAQRGSEHSINGRKYAAEIHFVHEKDSGDTNIIGPQPNKFAVVAVFLEIAKQAPYLNSFVEQGTKLRPEEVVIPQEDLNLEEYYPSNTNNFYLYNGSLTTPTCDEEVTWIVLKEANTITKSQLEQLRTLKGTEPNEQVTYNMRRLQPLNGRIVEQPSGQTLTKASSTLVIFLMLTCPSIYRFI